MVKKLICVIAAFALAAACVFLAASVSSVSVGAPQHIDAASPCPATGCASGECPDGVHEMVCPESTCASFECHAWETLVGGGYRSASDASLNLWVLGPVVFFGGLILVLKKVG